MFHYLSLPSALVRHHQHGGEQTPDHHAASSLAAGSSGSVRLVGLGSLVRLGGSPPFRSDMPRQRHNTAKVPRVTPYIAAISALVVPSSSSAGMRANMSSVIRDLFIAAPPSCCSRPAGRGQAGRSSLAHVSLFVAAVGLGLTPPARKRAD